MIVLCIVLWFFYPATYVIFFFFSFQQFDYDVPRHGFTRIYLISGFLNFLKLQMYVLH